MRPFSETPDLWGIRHFTGRTASVRRIVTWLGTRSRGMLVVTGPSGSGKSALLSYVAHLTIPEFYERLSGKPPLHLQPDLRSIHAAVHCRGRASRASSPNWHCAFTRSASKPARSTPPKSSPRRWPGWPS